MAEPVRVRRLTDQEGQKLQQIVRRGSTSSVRCRRAMMLPASADGNRVPVIAQLVQADEDTVREVSHRFNGIGLACLDTQWAGGRPRLLTPDDEDFVIQTATTRPTTLGRPFTRWSIRKLAAYLRRLSAVLTCDRRAGPGCAGTSADAREAGPRTAAPAHAPPATDAPAPAHSPRPAAPPATKHEAAGTGTSPSPTTGRCSGA
ncbi:hypothetical protein GCM10010398_63270 [Streptomyces fimbriatus]